MDTLENHYRDMCDIEFTIEKGRLWILQTRIGKRTAFAEWVMAHDMLAEGLIDEDRRCYASTRTGSRSCSSGGSSAAGADADRQGAERFARRRDRRGRIHAPTTREEGKRGEKVILVRRETTPDDYHGMIASQGILTSAGGTNSHAAVVARGEGIPAVCGADAIKMRVAAGSSAPTATR